MSVTPNVRRDAAPGIRAVSLAERMLMGGASCALTAWRLDSCYELVAHGLASDGGIIVAVRPPGDCPLSRIPAGVGVDVRLDLVRHSRDIVLNVVASSCHLLGVLTLLEEQTVARMVARGELPERIVELTRLPGTRVGVVDTDRLLVHDHSGLTPVPWSALDEELPDFPRDDFAVHDVIVSLDQEILKRLCDGVRIGLLPGAAAVRSSGPQVCPHVLDRVFCVDVDRTGVTLMHIGAEETVTAFVEFDSCPTSLACLEQAVMDVVNAA